MKPFCLATCFTALILCFTCPTHANNPSSLVTLTTSLGEVSGLRKPAGNGTQVDVFYSIPFAQPPVGELRFKPPVPAAPWKGSLDGTSRPNACWQTIDTSFDRFHGVEMWNVNTKLSEDCLFLNVYVPNRNRKSGPKPIMVWIYGGGFWSGSNSLDIYDATHLAARNDVIVVSIAYRVGALGFLYAGNEDAPGNAGLLDQAMALKWIKDNAYNLGGSPNDISLFGESAGAVSVGLHLMSPMTRDLFSNAIMESSSPIASWAIQEHHEAQVRTAKLAESVSCPSAGIEMMECLKSADPEILTERQWDLVDGYFDMTMGPVVDGEFLPDHPTTMLAKGDIKVTNVIVGVNKDEGIFFDVYAFQDDIDLHGNHQINEDQFNRILKDISPVQNRDEEVKRQYVRNTTSSYTDIVDDISGDVLFKCPVVDFAQAYSALGGRVFMYSFEYRMSSNPWPEWMGVPHGYEIEMVFGSPLGASSAYPSQEKELSERMMQLWTTFAHTGSPNKPGTATWPQYRDGEESYLAIDANGLSVNQALRRDECAFLSTLTSRESSYDVKSLSVELLPPTVILQ